MKNRVVTLTMSKYTTQVRYICETSAGLLESAGYNDVNDIVTQAAPVIFNFNFPIWDETYRPVLEKKILKHYYTREIAAETVGLWKLWLDTRLNEIMPYYNELYKTSTLEFNPLYDVDYTKDYKLTHGGIRANNVSGTSHDVIGHQINERIDDDTTTSGTSHSTDAYSDTPQGNLYKTLVTDDDKTEYLTNIRFVDGSDTGTVNRDNVKTGNNVDTTDGSNTSTLNETINNTDDYIEHIKGTNGGATFSKKILEYRKTLLNIDMMIIEELEDLFFGLW